jgi:Flavin-binding monooxygenase-like
VRQPRAISFKFFRVLAGLSSPGGVSSFDADVSSGNCVPKSPSPVSRQILPNCSSILARNPNPLPASLHMQWDVFFSGNYSWTPLPASLAWTFAADSDQMPISMPPLVAHYQHSAQPAAASVIAGKFCILGAGSSGLTVAKNFHERRIPFDCLDRESDIGGSWNIANGRSSIYRSTRLISSKRLTEFTDFPMPEEFPDHPSQRLICQYLRAYADHFDLRKHIQFNVDVERVERADDGGWNITLESGDERRYRGVVIANGHNWDPRWPSYPGQFDGETIHSSQYKTPAIVAGRRVLVVGGGNSGFDIAAESAQYASATIHSLRRGYHILPRFHDGLPVDECGEWMLRWRLPLWFRRLAAARVSRLTWERLGCRDLPRPDHQLFATHPVINSRWPLDVTRGAIVVKPDVAELRGPTVEFVGGSEEKVDLIIYATGYKISIPFMRPEELPWRDGRPELCFNVFHPDRDDLFVAGLIQSDSGQFGLVDCQAQLTAAYVAGLERHERRAQRFREFKRRHRSAIGRRIRYVDSPRHLVEVEHYSYRRTLEKWIRRLG